MEQEEITKECDILENKIQNKVYDMLPSNCTQKTIFYLELVLDLLEKIKE
jgi:hypothetical protein